jgi:hypothetical protein
MEQRIGERMREIEAWRQKQRQAGVKPEGNSSDG